MSRRETQPLLTAAVTPESFWRPEPGRIAPEVWEAALPAAIEELAGLPARERYRSLPDLFEDLLVERQFGPDHWRMRRGPRLYYRHLRPLLPAATRPLLRRSLLASRRDAGPLRWPLDDRFARFLHRLRDEAAAISGAVELPFLDFWPEGKRSALVLTHDVEGKDGVAFIREVCDLEERHGVRSSFNLVAGEYPIDPMLLGELEERGFEVGLHGVGHGGTLFLSRERFERELPSINRELSSRRIAGFRAPFTHRNPYWMQGIEAEYDASFFDTDPFETMPGGTMSLWPFMMGELVELPYTLPQDHTLFSTLGEERPTIWKEKSEAIERFGGMSLLISHPDYLRSDRFMAAYDEYLRWITARPGYWHALPRDVARWWRWRTIGIDHGEEAPFAPTWSRITKGPGESSL